MKFAVQIICFFVLGFVSLSAQVKDYELGADVSGLRYAQQSGNFDLSDPEAVNIKVSVWGWVKYTGKYCSKLHNRN